MKAKNCIKDLKRRERERPSDLQSPRSFAALLAIHVQESERNSKKENERKFKRLEEIFLVEIRTRFCSIFRSAK